MYLIEGNIGAGKSTLLSLIKEQLPFITTYHESVQSWDHERQGNSLLGHFYQDQNRWSYTMETYTLFIRAQEHLKFQSLPKKTTPSLMERSIYSGYYCFAYNGYLCGSFTETEWALYTKWFRFLAEEQCKTPLGFIYLQTEPEVCYQRSQERKRKSESDVPISYFRLIHERHEAFLIKKRGIFPALQEVPTLVLDASCNFKSDQEILNDYIEKINDFILLTQDKAPKISPLKSHAIL